MVCTDGQSKGESHVTANGMAPLPAQGPQRRMVALYDYDPQELSPNVDSEVGGFRPEGCGDRDHACHSENEVMMVLIIMRRTPTIRVLVTVLMTVTVESDVTELQTEKH